MGSQAPPAPSGTCPATPVGLGSAAAPYVAPFPRPGEGGTGDAGNSDDSGLGGHGAHSFHIAWGKNLYVVHQLTYLHQFI